MAIKFFKYLFASSGDTTDVPNTTQSDGSVSYQQGFGPDYQADPSDPDVLYPERTKFNDIMFNVTAALQNYQVHGFPDFITTSDNGGTPYPYDKNAWVRYSDGNVYFSLQDANVALPTDPTMWTMFTVQPAFVTGDTIVWESNVLRTGGWVWCNGLTIGNAGSGATGRANADTLALFTLYWSSFSNAVRPIQNSDGSAGTRGASASADFAANKRLPVADIRGNVVAGADNMGGAAAAGRLTLAQPQGVNGAVLGGSGGEQGHQLSSGENGTHTHGASGLGITTTGTPTAQIPLFTPSDGSVPPSSRHSVAVGNDNAPIGNTYNASITGSFTFAVTGSVGTSGSGTAHNTVQPTYISNWITKL